MSARLKKIKDEDLLGFKPGADSIRNEFGLLPKEELFVQAYLIEANATRAAKIAGYSHQTAGSIGYEMLRLPQITSRIAALRAKIEKNNDGLREKIINKLMVMADLDIASIYNKDGTMKPVHDWDLEARTSAISLDTVEGLGFLNTKKVKLTDRTKALEMLIKMQGYYAPEKVAQTDLDGNHVPPVININVIPPQKEVG